MKKLLPIFALLLVTSLISAQTVLFHDDFESYTVGQTVASQTSNWRTWSNGSPAAEAALVSSAQAVSGSKSMNIITNNDMIYSFGNKTTGNYKVDFYMYIPTGSQGYFNIEHQFGVEWAFSCTFNAGSMTLTNGATSTHAYTPSTWMHIVCNINLDEDEITLVINDTNIATWPFSNKEEVGSGTGMNQLGCINFYGPASNNYFIDDFTFTEIIGGLTPPTIEINSETISTNGETPAVISFGNVGEEPMTFAAYPKFTDPTIEGTLTHGQMNYDIENATAVGWTNSFVVSVAVRFHSEMLLAHLGQQIQSVDFYIKDAPVGDVTVSVWSKSGFISPGTTEVLAEKTLTPTPEAWNTALLEIPVLITGEEIWVGYTFTNPAGMFTLGIDNAALFPAGNYIKAGPVWSEFLGVSGSGQGNFNIRANVSGAGWPVWLSVAPQTGTVEPSQEAELTLSFNATDFAAGSYNATVVVGCNDPEHEWTEVPVVLDIVNSVDFVSTFSVMTYPNPANDKMNITSDGIISSIAVYSISGNLVKSIKVDASNTSINVATLAKGIYVMEIKIGNETLKRKLIVN